MVKKQQQKNRYIIKIGIEYNITRVRTEAVRMDKKLLFKLISLCVEYTNAYLLIYKLYIHLVCRFVVTACTEMREECHLSPIGTNKLNLNAH